MRVGTVVGRTTERVIFEGLVDDLRLGRGHPVWLEGEPGIGKSALVDALASVARAVGVRVFSGRAEELIRLFPQRPLCDALGVHLRSADPGRRAIGELLGGTAERDVLDPLLDPVLAGAEQLIDLVDDECATGPVLLVVEDLQWADPSTLSGVAPAGPAPLWSVILSSAPMRATARECPTGDHG